MEIEGSNPFGVAMNYWFAVFINCDECLIARSQYRDEGGFCFDPGDALLAHVACTTSSLARGARTFSSSVILDQRPTTSSR